MPQTFAEDKKCNSGFSYSKSSPVSAFRRSNLTAAFQDPSVGNAVPRQQNLIGQPDGLAQQSDRDGQRPAVVDTDLGWDDWKSVVSYIYHYPAMPLI